MKGSDVENLDVLLVQVMHLHHTRAHNLFSKIGIYRGQSPILFMLWNKDGRTQKELAGSLQLSPATITDTLKRMEKSGLVKRKADKDDMRVSRVYLTQKGRDIRSEVEGVMAAMNEEVFDGFILEEKILLRRFLLQIKDNLTELIEKSNCSD